MIGKTMGSAALLLCGTLALQAQADVRMNQIQVVGSHNSYHAGLTPGVKAILAKQNPKALRSLDYSHPTLTKQLDSGVRQLEIDVHADAKGGRYAHIAADDAIAKAGLPADPPYNTDGKMNQPGFKVMHVTGIDQRTRCTLFTDCLREVQAWSKAHPKHVPLFLLIEAKEEQPHLPGTPMPEPFTPAVFDALDKEIRSVFTPAELITPDDVRGSGKDLPSAITEHGWPTLESARGKVVFLLDNRKFTAMYSEGHPALRGRVLFTNSAPGTPESAFEEQNNGTAESIDASVKQGIIVRTRTDEGTEEARTNDTTRRELALRSGAQIISTDYPPGEKSQWSDFIVELPNGLAARCNPLIAPKDCSDAAVNDK
ncbi:phosphatidylinositol-specific phospholipase C1-like protein [Terriglobus aquaticus]|uniref:Phosphatidylinositol-specific phospholipase C1-like protein n=1 Tax=Terriglobus aquaticus TaxID=940139 RepID=A0ABW9KNX9_9BACT|nr:phosphatidylinositol-specific phospholipase C1-like protein [Terriglobus aquaticus]